MPIIIDGHNLIPQIPGIELSDPDDEAKLIRRLKAYCDRSNRKATVYFDSGFPGMERRNPSLNLTVHFVLSPRTADDAIIEHIQRLGREAPNWTIVSDDREIKAEARYARAQLMSSSAFAQSLTSPTSEALEPEEEKPVEPVSAEEIQEWEQLFNNQGKNPDSP